MSVLKIFSSTLIQNTMSYGARRNVMPAPPAFQVKQSATVMMWGGMTGRGLTKLHMPPTGHYINDQILEKEVKPLTSRRSPELRHGFGLFSVFISHAIKTKNRNRSCSLGLPCTYLIFDIHVMNN